MSDKKHGDKPIKPTYLGNSIMVRPNGPLICKGDDDISLFDASGKLLLKDKEFALCRCGESKNKPFCDGSHKSIENNMQQSFNDSREENIDEKKGELDIIVKNNAMYTVKGPVTIFSRDGLSKTTRMTAALCRCGHSENKPFCDVNHKKCGFTG